MPVHVRKSKGDSVIKGPHWDIVTKTGKVEGHSKTRRDAEISASIKNREHKKKTQRRRGRRSGR